MAEDLYAKPDLTKKVRFQKGEKEDSNEDVREEIQSVNIYDNCWAEERIPPKSQDSTTDDQQQSIDDQQQSIDDQQRGTDQPVSTSVNVTSAKRSHHRASIVFLGLLCLFLLAAVIVLVVLLIQDKNNWNTERNQLRTKNDKLTNERDRTESENNHLKVVNNNLTHERDELQTSYSEMESLNHNLTQRTSRLQSENNHLKVVNNNLTKERDELQKQIEKTCCPEKWTRFQKSCYFISNEEKKWTDSRKACENYGAHLVIIDNSLEQAFISQLNLNVWIGLSYEKRKKEWRWVDGSPLTKDFWGSGQPSGTNKDGKDEHCGGIAKWIDPPKNLNDKYCEDSSKFVCEKTLS